MDLVDQAGRLGEQGLSDRVLRTRFVDEIARRVPFDGHLFAMTDPVSRVVSSPHANLPMVSGERLPDLIRQRYALPSEDWPAWLEAEFGIADVVTLPLRDRHGDWGFLELWLTRGRFSPDQHRVLSVLTPVLTRALREAVARTFAHPDASTDNRSTARGPATTTGVILMGEDMRVRSETDGAAMALLELLPPEEEVPPVPAVAFNVAAALLAAESRDQGARVALRVPGVGAWTRVHLGGGWWMTARAERIAGGLVVSLSPSSAVERVDLFARCHSLTPREVEVLGLLVRGHRTREIAQHLVIAPTTAEDHLRALLAKTRSTSRQQLILRAVSVIPSLGGDREE